MLKRQDVDFCVVGVDVDVDCGETESCIGPKRVVPYSSFLRRRVDFELNVNPGNYLSEDGLTYIQQRRSSS